MSELDKLIDRVKKTAKSFGGLLSLLLGIRAGAKVNFVNAKFIVDGRAVPAELIQKELGRVELKVAALIFSFNERLWNKQWTLEKWREEMDKLLENNHVLMGAIALGSFAASASSETVVRRIARDKAAIERFSKALSYGQIPSLALMQNRGRAYLRSLYVTYQLVKHQAHIIAGYNEARRILTPAEHCRTQTKPPYLEGCLEVAAKGWLDIVKMPPIGTLHCGQFCKCYLIYR